MRDWRYIVPHPQHRRVGSDQNASSGADLLDLMAQALEVVEDLNMGTPAFYGNHTIASYLRRQIVNKVASSTLSMGEVLGRKVMMMGEVPFYKTDAIPKHRGDGRLIEGAHHVHRQESALLLVPSPGEAPAGPHRPTCSTWALIVT